MKRLYWLILPATTLGLILLALPLSPHPSGLGTHQSLGLPPCFFLNLTGFICPSCGLTTSWAYLLNGDIAAAWVAHPLGPLLFVLTMVTSLICLRDFFASESWLKKIFHRLRPQPLMWGCYGALGIYFGVWFFQLMLKV